MSNEDNMLKQLRDVIARSISHNETVTVTVEDVDKSFAMISTVTDDDYDYVPTETKDGIPQLEIWVRSINYGGIIDKWHIALRAQA